MLAQAIDIRAWLHRDRTTPFAGRLVRDRNIGHELQASSDRDQVLAWWCEIGAQSKEPSTGHRAEAMRRVVSVALLLVGAVLGAGIAGVTFAYQGEFPVNLFSVLGVLVALPGILLIASLTLLPGRLPGFGALQGALAGLNLSRWVSVGLDRYLNLQLFAPRYLDGAGGSGVIAGTGRRRLGRFARWQLLLFAQWLAVGFFVGVLLLTLLLVTFTDLAFGWSTTLDLDAAVVARFVDLITLPWAGWLPVASPELALVEVSRYFRLEDGGVPAGRPGELGAWWPFVAMAVLVYGLVPRLLLLIMAAIGVRRASAALLLDDPEVTALLDRMRTPAVLLDGEPEEAPDDDQSHLESPPPGPITAQSGCSVLIWNEALSPQQSRNMAARSLSASVSQIIEMNSVQGDDERSATLAKLDVETPRLVIFTKGWEPPLLEFLDLLQLLRERLGPQTSVVVVPVDVTRERVSGADREIWSQMLARMKDGRVYVAEAHSPGRAVPS